MARTDSAPSDRRAQPPLDAPWVLDPPSRLTFPDREPLRARLSRALAERVGNALRRFGASPSGERLPNSPETPERSPSRS